jgi:photosystem II stability/assembly factor-like uncharacterized protein
MRAMIVFATVLFTAACDGRDPTASARRPNDAILLPSVGSPNEELSTGAPAGTTPPSSGPGGGGTGSPSSEPPPPACALPPSREAFSPSAPICTQSVVATDLTITSIWSSSSALFVASDAGSIFTSVDGGATWSLVISSAGDYLTAITGRGPDLFATGADIADRGSRGSPIVVQQSGTWTESRITSSLWASGIAASDSSLVVVDDLISVSRDNGNSWNFAAAPVATYSAVVFANCGEFLVPGTFDDGSSKGHGTIARSRDGGTTWFNITVPGGPSAIAAHDETYLMSHFDGRLSRSTDGGATWNTAQLASKSLRGLSMNSTGELTITVGDDGVLYYSTDTGASWSNVGLTADGLRAARVSNTDRRAYVAGSNGAFFSCAF